MLPRPRTLDLKVERPLYYNTIGGDAIMVGADEPRKF